MNKCIKICLNVYKRKYNVFGIPSNIKKFIKFNFDIKDKRQ